VDEWFERSPFIGFVPWIIYWVVADGPTQIYPTRARDNARPA